jgi:putative ATP-dependent endonuclease of the OLD family
LEQVSDTKTAWQIIKHDFIRLYTYKIFGGDANLQAVADNESLQKFDFQFLDAIRDVERDMFTGRNTLLREVLDFFMDYEIKNDKTKTEDERKAKIKEKKQEFSTKADALVKLLQLRMEEGKEHILSYASETGASFNKATPNFEGALSDIEMFNAIRLIVEYETGIVIPATHNGLGYNNLIFMSLLLAKLQVNSDGNYLDTNAKVFPILTIEEPEAHLHPAMQYKFLKFLRENKDVKKKVRQVFVTTHSTQITSAVSLDEIICLHSEHDKLTVGYPGRVFSSDENGKKAKGYVQRFLDSTRSDMLFAQRVILVEGLAEQLLLSVLARYSGKSLEDNHIAVINIGGRYFDYFLLLFDSTISNAIPKKVACIIDRDPERKEKAGGQSKRCYPFEYNQDLTRYDYRDNSTEKIDRYRNHANIRFFSQEAEKGITFEYDLALHNSTSEILITMSTNNQAELKELMLCQRNNEPLSVFESKLRSSEGNTRIIDAIMANTSWSEGDKKKAIVASRYLNSIGKGENALELAYSLEENLQTTAIPFTVPPYIEEAIKWICQ